MRSRFILSVLGIIFSLTAQAVVSDGESGFVKLVETTVNELSSIRSKRIYLELVFDSRDKEALIRLENDNLKDGYIRTLWIDSESVNEAKIASLAMMRHKANIKARMERADAFKTLFYLVRLQVNGTIIGALEMSSYQESNSAMLGVFISKDEANRGYGTEATLAAMNFLQEKSTAPKVYWLTHSDNLNSIKIAERCGMSFVKEWQPESGSNNNRFRLYSYSFTERGSTEETVPIQQEISNSNN